MYGKEIYRTCANVNITKIDLSLGRYVCMYVYMYVRMFILTVLNSDDRCVRAKARNSLKLHMSLRKIPMAEPRQGCFAGYSVVDGKLNKQSSFNWPKSFWVNIFEMCQREGISLRLRGDLFTFETVLDDDTSFICESPIGFRKFLKDKKKYRVIQLLGKSRIPR